MNAPKINTARKVVPMIYAYASPEIARLAGWTKIGYTEKQSVEERIAQQTHTANVKTVELWRGSAVFDDGSGDVFRDSDFHAYLTKCGYEREKGNEWFRISGPESKSRFNDFRSDRGLLKPMETVVPYRLREEQADAVRQALDYRKTHRNGEFLWNAKPRFGKTLSVYDLANQMNAQMVLIVTNRPAIANSWFEDYARFFGPGSGYSFVSEVDALKGRPGVLTREEFNRIEGVEKKLIEFVSLQDLKGSRYFGGKFDKLKEIEELTWDLLVIDEAHEGVDTLKTDVAFDKIKRGFTLHLSGTPFKALANNKFPEEAVFNWTYADEQRSKADWDEGSGEPNPYEELPRLNLFTYKMSEIVRDKLEKGLELDDEYEDYAFDLNEFFAVSANGRFSHDESVDKFLDALTLQTKFPFSTPELRAELCHTLWLLDRVESARALAKKLKTHPVFKDYEIILAAGDGKLSEDDAAMDSYKKTVQAIQTHEKTITLSVGQLTTGITIPEWTAVLMLSNIKSPSLYMQAAFRAQNPCLFRRGTGFARKENAYVFDFDPARTLIIFESFANDLYSDTGNGRGDPETRKLRIRELLNFFPVIGEDEEGELTELDAEKVLSVPRKIRSIEVVRRGFMSNFLFQNIDRIFGAPKEVIQIINTFEPVQEPGAAKQPIPETMPEGLTLDENGDVVPDTEKVIGLAADLFGKKIYKEQEALDRTIDEIREDEPDTAQTWADALKKQVSEQVKENVALAKETFGEDLKKSDSKRLEAKLNAESSRIIETSVMNREIERNTLEKERDEALQNRHETGKSSAEIDREFTEKLRAVEKEQLEELSASLRAFTEKTGQEIVETVEKNRQEKEKTSIEEKIRNRLRGFSRTIPSFLMAYGDERVTLDTFDRIIPDAVFIEVTGITPEQFRFLRDGGDYTDEESGEVKHFEGQLFDPVVFDDSVKEFLKKRAELANYFDENLKEDIFDYVPPQKTNQIFTPKRIVKQMVDLLEQENPGCFDDPNHTFIDLYMKSGLYIAEIVKRLYQSTEMKRLFPDGNARLRHIFSRQVYGLAPTAIIYNIAEHFILGFSDTVTIETHNLRQADALPYAKAGNLPFLLEELYGNQ